MNAALRNLDFVWGQWGNHEDDLDRGCLKGYNGGKRRHEENRLETDGFPLLVLTCIPFQHAFLSKLHKDLCHQFSLVRLSENEDIILSLHSSPLWNDRSVKNFA